MSKTPTTQPTMEDLLNPYLCEARLFGSKQLVIDEQCARKKLSEWEQIKCEPLKKEIEECWFKINVVEKKCAIMNEMLIEKEAIIEEFKNLRAFFFKGSPLTNLFDKIISENNL